MLVEKLRYPDLPEREIEMVKRISARLGVSYEVAEYIMRLEETLDSMSISIADLLLANEEREWREEEEWYRALEEA